MYVVVNENYAEDSTDSCKKVIHRAGKNRSSCLEDIHNDYFDGNDTAEYTKYNGYPATILLSCNVSTFSFAKHTL